MNFIVKISNILFPLIIILFAYPIGYLNLGYTLLILFVSISFLAKKKHEKWLFFFSFYCFFYHFIFIYLEGKSVTSGLTIILIYLSVIAFSNFISEDYLYKILKVIGVFVMIGLFYHLIQIYLFGIEVKTILFFDTNLIGYENKTNSRPVSFFSEPQAYASFMMPLLFLSIKKKEFIWTSVVTISIILSGSLQGLVMTSVFLFFLFKQIRFIDKFLIISIISFLMLVSINGKLFNFFNDKINNIEIDSDVRLSRGFVIYGTMNPFEKAFGVGFGQENVKNYAQNQSSLSSWANLNERAGHTSTFSGLLVQFGYVGMFLFLIFLINMYYNSKKENRIFIIVICAAAFSQNILFNGWFVYFIAFYLGINFDGMHLIKKNI